VKQGTPSATAAAMAAARAFGTVAFRAEAILDDPFAEHFLAGAHARLHRLVRRDIRLVNRGLTSLYEGLLPGGIGYILARHRTFDDAIVRAVEGGATQVVMVGAGYDSRALRQPALAAARIFEIDHPDTQARKKEIVARLLGRLPANVDYISLNATQGDLRQLPGLGFDQKAKAVFVLEGFLWYMPPDVARAILAAVAAIGAPGSLVIFDHILPSVVDGSCTLEGARAHRRYCARRGEPILWGIEPAALPGFLDEVGLRLVDDVGHDALSALSAPARLKVYPFLRIARAEISPRS
jgi:methyltransferase (TIGR00027 family)